MTLTKDLIIDSIYKNTDLMKPDAAQTFQSLIEIMKQSLESGEDILISGFPKIMCQGKEREEGEESCNRQRSHARRQEGGYFQMLRVVKG